MNMTNHQQGRLTRAVAGMSRILRGFASLPLLGMLAVGSGTAKAQSCGTFLSDINNWFLTQPDGPGTYKIRFTVVTNRTDGNYASYSEGSVGSLGTLTYRPARWIRGISYPPALQGTMTQYFSDRRYAPNGSGLIWAPFDPGRTDSLGVTILLESGFLATQGEVILTLKSWGGTALAFQGQCTGELNDGSGGLIYGVLQWPPQSGGSTTMAVMSLNEVFTPNPQ
jgi:hypothetical protein